MKGEKRIAPMDFANILQNQTLQRTAKFIIAGFNEMYFMRGGVKLVKIDELYNVLKNQLATGYYSRGKG